MTGLHLNEPMLLRNTRCYISGMNETEGVMDDWSIQFWTEGVLLTTVSVLGTLANLMRYIQYILLTLPLSGTF